MSKVKADMSGVAAKINKIKNDQGLGELLASTAERGMAKFVPKRTGALEASGHASPFKVTYNTPYARRIYHGDGFKFNTNGNPLARAYWDQGYIEAGGREQLAEEGTKYLKGRG